MNIDQFWDRTTVDEDGCWVWTGSRNNSGYGRARFGGEVVYAHRLAWEQTHGVIPEGLLVMHTCDKPACIRPDHLTVGTTRENVRDMWSKGRQPRQFCGGQSHASARLSHSDVSEIRRLWARGGMTQREIGLRYGVTQSSVSRIVLRKSWTAGVAS